MNQPNSLSHTKTTLSVIRLLRELDLSTAKIADVGAGNGHFSMVLGEELKQAHGIDPGQSISACDVLPEEFTYEPVTCKPVLEDGRLPYDDHSFDAVISIEVIEHVEDQFYFFRELKRITRPGGLVIVTTPNVMHMQSRMRSLIFGFAELFDPLPLESHDVRYLGGHIHPIGPYYMAYNALRSGLETPSFHYDRTKRSAAAWTVLLSPFLLLGTLAHRRRMQRKRPDLVAQNKALLPSINCWNMLTSRTAILRSVNPAS